MFHVNCTPGHNAISRAFHKFKHAPILNAEEAVFALEAPDHSAVARATKDTDCFAEYCEGIDYKGPYLNDVRASSPLVTRGFKFTQEVPLSKTFGILDPPLSLLPLFSVLPPHNA